MDIIKALQKLGFTVIKPKENENRTYGLDRSLIFYGLLGRQTVLNPTCCMPVSMPCGVRAAGLYRPQ